MYRDDELVIRKIIDQDMPILWELIFKEEEPEYKKWDAPYYPHKAISYETFMVDYASWIDADSFWGIEINGCIKGTLNYYWEHKPSH